MHEVAIAQSLIQIVQGELKTRGVKANVERVVVKAGKFNAIIPDSLNFHFDLLKIEDAQLHDCKLVIEEISVMVFCADCQKEIELQNPLFLCESCGTPLTALASDSNSGATGKELYIDHIEVADS